jgi:hypothetical protein
MAESVFCKNCGAAVTGEAASGDPAQRNPCPHCGSLARNYTLHASGGLYNIVGGITDLLLITYPEALLATAQDLIAKGEFSIAVVVAHMACEIGAERVLSRAFTTKGIGYLEESVEELLPGYNLANYRVRKLYNAVTGDQIQTQPFWQAFKESATRRNQAVHKGRMATKAEAETSFKAASDLVAYLKEIGK